MSKAKATKPSPSATSSPSTDVTKSNDDSAASLRKSFRSFASALIVTARSAEKVVAADITATDPAKRKAAKDAQTQLDSAVQMILKQRQSVRRTATLLESKLRGNVKESEALHCCLRSQPCVGGGRKRKFSLTIDGDVGRESTTATTTSS